MFFLTSPPKFWDTPYLFVPGERNDREHPEHVKRHEHRPPPAEPDLGQDQFQGQQRHHKGQDGKRASGGADEIRSLSVRALMENLL